MPAQAAGTGPQGSDTLAGAAEHVPGHAAGAGAPAPGQVTGTGPDLPGRAAFAAGPDAPVTSGPPVRGYVRRPDGTAVHGATITLIDRAGRQAGRGRSEPDGSYRVQTPGAGTYTLVAAAASCQPLAATVAVGGQPADQDIVLTGSSSLTGTVRAAGSGTPVPGATACLADSGGGIVTAGRTDETGRYLLADLDAGSYTLAVSAPGRQPAALPVVISAGRQSTLDAELASRGWLEGTARTARGEAVPDALVTVLDAAGNVAAVTTTAADGTYALDNLAAGEYTVVAAGYPPAASTLRLSPAQSHAHDLLLGHRRR